MKNTTKTGNIAEAQVVAALMKLGKNVLLPFGGGLRYDMAVFEDGQFTRIQCKTGRLRLGCVEFNNYSTTDAGDRAYGDEVDAYGVFCPQNGKVYLVPAKECAATVTKLRVEPPRNGMVKHIRLARKYEL